jgi:tetratricopeptide (TPR) repeat protein
MLIITHQFEPHRAVLAPFLDSLPSSKFTWEIESAEMAEHMGQILYAKASHFYRQHKADGERHKEEGNAAFRRGDRKGAIAAYTQALRRFEDAHCQKVLEEDKKVVMKLMALTIANRSAAAVSPGEGQDIELAINDGKKAILANPHYAKGLVELSRKNC